MRVLNAPGSGPWMGEVLSRVVEWQLEHASGTKGECEEWLHGENIAGRIKIGTTQSKRGRTGGQGQPKKRVKTENE